MSIIKSNNNKVIVEVKKGRKERRKIGRKEGKIIGKYPHTMSEGDK